MIFLFFSACILPCWCSGIFLIWSLLDRKCVFFPHFRDTMQNLQSIPGERWSLNPALSITSNFQYHIELFGRYRRNKQKAINSAKCRTERIFFCLHQIGMYLGSLQKMKSIYQEFLLLGVIIFISSLRPPFVGLELYTVIHPISLFFF